MIEMSRRGALETRPGVSRRTTMKRPVARCLKAISASASAFACTVALAQVLNSPPVPGELRARGTPAIATGPVPLLLTPAANFRINIPVAEAYAQDFRWSAPRGPTPEHYVLCVVVDPRTDCPGSSDFVTALVTRPPSTFTQFRLMLPATFHRKTLYWTVAACGAGYGPSASTLLRPNDRYARCAWAPRRKLDALVP
jgi:hypothetical protein